jgi:DNA ligase D
MTPRKPARAVDVAGRTVLVTNPHKVLFPRIGATKLDVVEFYLAVGDPVLRQLRDRPVLMQRYPNGVEGGSFFQKRVPPSAPEWLTTAVVTTPNGTSSDALVIADLAHVVWAVNLGCLGFHSWPVRVGADGRIAATVDELRIDLDPQPGTTFAMAVEAAHLVRSLLAELGLVGFVKTSGSRGLHVYLRLLPRWDAEAVRSAAVALARELERRRPHLVTAQWWKEQRGPRIFVDFNQNAPHKTMFAPWSVRALPHAPVSTPLPWHELDSVDPASLTISSVPGRVGAQGDPWAEMDEHPNDLEPLLELARRDQERGLPDAPWPPEYPKMPGEETRVSPSRARRPD